MNGIAIHLCSEIHRLEAEFHDSSYAATERNYPSTTVRGFPICGQRRLPREVPTVSQVVIDKVLKNHLVHIRTAGLPGK